MQAIQEKKESAALASESNRRRSFQLLRSTFCLLILVTGVDKFFNLLTDWEHLLTPVIPQLLHMSATNLMHVAGVSEILLAVIISLKPRLGLPLAAALFIGLVINLLTIPGELHLAVLDLSFFVCTVATIILDLPVTEKKIG